MMGTRREPTLMDPLAQRDDLNGVDNDPLPEPSPFNPHGAFEHWGRNIAAMLTGIAAGLPEELTPQSRYQLALQLTQTLLQTQLASALVPPGGQA